MVEQGVWVKGWHRSGFLRLLGLEVRLLGQRVELEVGPLGLGVGIEVGLLGLGSGSGEEGPGVAVVSDPLRFTEKYLEMSPALVTIVARWLRLRARRLVDPGCTGPGSGVGPGPGPETLSGQGPAADLGPGPRSWS